MKFPEPSDMQDAIEAYFDETAIDQYTITGLALALGSSRRGILDYQRRKGYIEIVSRAKLVVENSYELSLRKHGRSGDIFALKNFGWQDKIVQERVRDEKEQIEIDEMQAEIEALKSAGDGIPTI